MWYKISIKHDQTWNTVIKTKTEQDSEDNRGQRVVWHAQNVAGIELRVNTSVVISCFIYTEELLVIFSITVLVTCKQEDVTADAIE